MTNARFFDNPRFIEYLRLLGQLHRLIREGTDELAEGQALRDRMNLPGELLDGAETESLQGISEVFYLLGAESWVALPMSASTQLDLQAILAARDAKDFIGALDRLRKNRRYLEPAVVLHLVGSILTEVGEHELAAEFVQRAESLKPNSASGGWMRLDALARGQFAWTSTDSPPLPS